MITLSFYGAAGTVTGSKYLLSVNDKHLLIDCGMFQGRRELRQKNWDPMPFDPAAVSAVIVTHAHVDHIGYLPRLSHQGFSGPIYATPPTVEIAQLSLRDAAHIQEEDAAYRNKKNLTRHEVALPLFTEADVRALDNRFQVRHFNEWARIGDGMKFRFHVAGHILGAAFVEVALDDGHKEVSVLFSGDVGRYGNPLAKDPAEPPPPDYLVCESTYGGRVHTPEDTYFRFKEIITEIIDRKSILLAPAFAIGRTQQITYLISDLIKKKEIPKLDIHIDSPMAIKSTDIYVKYPDYHRVGIGELKGKKSVLNGENVFLHRKKKFSKMLNKLKGPAVILSASGMMTAGRILHHLINRLPDPDTSLLVAGFMAEGTIGRRLVEGEKMVYIHKQPVEVRARIVKINGLSGHADFIELLHWLEPIRKPPQRTFITHGEPKQSEELARHLREKRNWDCHVPQLYETVEL